MQPSGVLARQALTIVQPRNPNSPGRVTVQLSQGVRNARRVFINDLKVKIPDPAPAAPPLLVRLEFQSPGLLANDLNVHTQFVALPIWEAATLSLRESWGYPGFTFAEVAGRDVPTSFIDFKVTDEGGQTIDFDYLAVKFTVEYDGSPNSATSSSYAYPNVPTVVPAPTKTVWPNWAGTLGPPY